MTDMNPKVEQMNREQLMEFIEDWKSSGGKLFICHQTGELSDSDLRFMVDQIMLLRAQPPKGKPFPNEFDCK